MSKGMESGATALDEPTDYGHIEKAILAALILQPDSIMKVKDRLSAEMFTEEVHQGIFEVIRELDDEGKLVDLLTVSVQWKLKKPADYTAYEGLDYLRDSILANRGLHQIDAYCEMIVNAYQVRMMHATLLTKEQELEAGVDLLKVIADLQLMMDDLVAGYTKSEEMLPIGVAAANTLAMLRENQRLRESGKPVGVPSGLLPLDKIIYGFNPGNLIILAARPSDGKSALALFMAYKNAQLRLHTAFFSLEMSLDEIEGRLLSMSSHLESRKIMQCNHTPEEWRKLDVSQTEQEPMPMIVGNCNDNTIEQLRMKAYNLWKKGELDILFIDYINLVNLGKGNKNQTMDLALGYVARRLKSLANELKIPIVVLSQMNRDIEKRHEPYSPLLSDLRNSGEIEQVADMVLFVQRPMRMGLYYDKKLGIDWTNKVRLTIKKNRNGSTGIVQLAHNEWMTQFSSVKD